MAENYLGSHLSFDRGIDLVTYVHHDDGEKLPLRREGAPSELGGRPKLEALLDQPTLDQFLEDSIRPQLENRELMVPSRFQSTLDSLHKKLSASLEQEGGVRGESWQAEDKRVIQRAVMLLNSEQDLRNLLNMYRSVLYQG